MTIAAEQVRKQNLFVCCYNKEMSSNKSSITWQIQYSSFERRQVQGDTAMRNNIAAGYPAHHKQKKNKRFTIVA